MASSSSAASAPRRARLGGVVAVVLVAALAGFLLARTVAPAVDEPDRLEGEDEFCFFTAQTRTLALVAEPADDSLTVLPLLLDRVADSAPAEGREDAERLADAADQAADEGTVAPLQAAEVQQARQRLEALAATTCDES